MTGKPRAEATVKLSLIDRITGPLKRISARLSALGTRLGFDRIGASVNRLGKSIIGLGNGLTRTTARLSSFVALLGLGASGAVAGAFALAKSASDLGSEIGESSFKLGIGVEALQEYRYAAKMSGIESETLTKGIQKLGINASEAVKGNKQMAKSFRALGVPLKDTKGKMRSTEAVLNDTFTALSKIKDPLRRNALAFKLFGKSGVDMMKMLSDGAGGLRNMREEARRLGIILSDRATKAADAFGDNLDSLLLRFEGLKLFLGVQLLPVLNEVIEAVTKWFDANANVVRSAISEWVQKFAQVLRDLMNPASDIRQHIAGMAEGFSSFLATIKPVVDFLGGPMNATLLVLGAWTAAPLITALTAVTAAFVTLGITIMATPVGWILAAVAAIAAAAYLIYQNWDSIAKWFRDFWDYVKGLFASAVAYIQGIAGKLYDAGVAMVQSIWDGLKSKWADVVAWLKGAVNDLVGWLPDVIKTKLGIDINTAKLPEGPNAPAARAGAAVGALVPPKVETPPPPSAPFVSGQKPADMGSLSATIRDLMKPLSEVTKQGSPTKTDEVDAGTVKAASIQIAEPLTVHEPQQINAPFSVTLTVNAPGADARAISAAVEGALAKQAAAHRSTIQSSLSD